MSGTDHDGRGTHVDDVGVSSSDRRPGCGGKQFGTTIVETNDFRKRLNVKAVAAEVTFYSALHKDATGADRTLVISATAADGDAAGLIQRVIERQGIGVTRNGIYHWMPWPCAALEVRDLERSNDVSHGNDSTVVRRAGSLSGGEAPRVI
jgi:hypothetical protein